MNKQPKKLALNQEMLRNLNQQQQHDGPAVGTHTCTLHTECQGTHTCIENPA